MPLSDTSETTDRAARGAPPASPGGFASLLDVDAKAGDAPHGPASRRAIFLIVGATLCFSVLDSMIKYLSQTYPVTLLVWARYFVQALALAVWLGPQVGLRIVRTDNLTSQLFRGTVLLASSLCFMSALKVMPLAEVTALNYSTPAVVTILAVVFLDERMTPVRVAFVGAGLVGMLLIVRPGSGLFQGVALFALGAAWFYAMFQVVTRKIANEDWRTLMFYPALVGTLAMSFVVPFLDWPDAVRWQDVAMIVAGGLIATFGHFLFLRAFQTASASAVTPFTYMQLVWATLIGWIVFGTFPDFWTLVGMAVITGSGLLIMYHEQRKAKAALAAPTVVE
jgi:drug/metabolite transporter (DMT)-like permease